MKDMQLRRTIEFVLDQGSGEMNFTGPAIGPECDR